MALSALATGLTAAETIWHPRQALIFVALVACGAIAVEATRGLKEPQGTASRDLQSIWYLAIAIVLVPFYAFLAPILLCIYKIIRTRPVVLYRRISSNAAISIAYGSASLLFHIAPSSVAGPHPGTQMRALTWTAVVIGCGIVGWVINHLLFLMVVIKLSDPDQRFRDIAGSRESITSDTIELSLAVCVALVVAINPVLMALALPSVVMQRRYLMRVQLVTNARIDASTGLLNAVTWRREAAAELIRALRSSSPVALAIVDIDHFEDLNAVGELVRDQLLRDVASLLRDQLPGHDLIGRTGGNEFAILLPSTGEAEARRISEQLRDRIAAEPIAIESGNQAGYVFRLTVSIGVAVLNQSRRALAELIGAADSALGEAKSTGWNKVYVLADATTEPDEQ